jgi:hypothetical protein
MKFHAKAQRGRKVAKKTFASAFVPLCETISRKHEERRVVQRTRLSSLPPNQSEPNASIRPADKLFRRSHLRSRLFRPRGADGSLHFLHFLRRR